MLPVREESVEERQYQENLAIVRERILSFVVRRLAPHRVDFAQAEDVAQSCVMALWEQYRDKRDLAEMVRIAIGVARHKIAQFHRERGRMPGADDAGSWELHEAHNPHSAGRVIERIAARETTDRLLFALLRLPERCRELLRLKLIEQKSYPEI